MAARRTRAAVLLSAGLATAGPAGAAEAVPGFRPEIALTAISDDNILRTDGAEQRDAVLVLSPALAHTAVFGKHVLETSYFGAYARHNDYGDEDYNDSRLAVDLLLDLTPQLDVSLNGAYTWSHDARGASGAGTVQALRPDRWEDRRLRAEFLYGRRTSRGQLGLAVESGARAYTNNGQETRDRDITGGEATFYYNATAKTAALLEVARREIDYVNPGALELDSTETRYSLGVKWEATRQSTGGAKIGYLTKDLKSGALADFDGLYVSADMVWEPRPVDRVTLNVARRPQESTQQTAGYFIANTVSVFWEHQLTELVAFNVDAGLQKDDYSDDRGDDYRSLGVGLLFGLREQLDLEVRYERSRRDSDVAGLDFTDNLLAVSLTSRFY